MAQEITIPRLGWSMEEGIFGEWLKAHGDYVEAGDMVFVLEGEKAANEIESLERGYLHIPDNGPRPGETVKVGQVIGFLLGKGETAPSLATSPSAPSATPASKSSNPEPAQPAPVPIARDASAVRAPMVPQSVIEGPPRVAGPAARRLARELGIDLNAIPTPDPTGRVLAIDVERADRAAVRVPSSVASDPVASPRARRRAQDMGIDWRTVRGTGRHGRIRERDILGHAPAATAPTSRGTELPPSSPGRHVPASKLRLILAQRMLAGVTQAAPVTLHTKIDAGSLVAYRHRLKDQSAGGSVPSYNDILLWLTARTLRERPDLNACWYRDGIHHYDDVHIATAVDSDGGLLAPVIRDADRKPLEQIAVETRQLIAAARSGTLNQSMLQGGTFTVTNLGMFGIDAFTPVLNLPQSGILGVGRIVEEPVVREGRVVPGQILTLSLTFDHRVVDGAPAARWLQHLCESIHSLDAVS